MQMTFERTGDETGRTQPRERITRVFSTEGTHPYDEIEWETRDAVIPGEGGNVFEQKAVEVPKAWSQTATNVVASKYFRGKLGSPERETSVRQMIDRVVRRITEHGRENGYFLDAGETAVFADELTWLLVNQHASFNSPVWFNIGVPGVIPQAAACFILSVDDSMDSILDWFKNEGVIFKGGSGSGINVSAIRSSREQLSGGGFASGPVSFMRGADSVAGSIKSGGTTRRAAKMVVCNVDHPDVREFIWCKAKEEKKAWALGEAGYDMGLNGEAWQSIQFQNANNSVRVNDEFMRAVEADDDWALRSIMTGEVIETVKARAIMQEIAEAAWQCGDPGMQFDTACNYWHTRADTERNNATNPCFPAGVRVHTTKGLLPIEQLYARVTSGERIEVYTHRATAERPADGVLASEPLAVYRNGVSPIVRLTFSDGRELRCTPNHRLWTTNRGYVQAIDLTQTDNVLLVDAATPAAAASTRLPAQVAEPIVSRSRRYGLSTEQRQDAPTRWSTDLGEIIGQLVGDGCLTDEAAIWTYGAEDTDLESGTAAAHAEVLKRLLGGISWNDMANGTVQLRSGAKATRELLGQLGVLSVTSEYKRVPSSIFEAPASVQAAFLRGLFGADGCVSRIEGGKASRYVGLGSASARLLRDVQVLLSAFGIRARIYTTRSAGKECFPYTRRDGTEVSYTSGPMFDLRITGTDLERFASAIGFSSSSKQLQLQRLLEEAGRYRTKPTIRLVSREEDGQAVVYNLNEPIHHSYIVDGFVVANCSEYVSIDNSACNLASMNLTRFANAQYDLDADRLRAAVRILITSQEILVGLSAYPTPLITRNARAHRELGLGYANLGALLMARGVPYDSDEGRAYAAAVTAIMTGEAYAWSAQLAARVGPYDAFAANRTSHQRVMRQHLRATDRIDERLAPSDLVLAARSVWENAVAGGAVHGYRNAQVTVLAPTGTISFMMDCDTTGVEPDIALVKYKKLVGGGMLKLVNGVVPVALARLGYDETQRAAIAAYIEENNSVEDAPHLRKAHYAIFDCAFKSPRGTRSISRQGHVRMMAAVQPFLSGAISKTVNLPETATVDEVMETYIDAWRQGIKAIAVYRDGSKKVQPLSAGPDKASRKTAEAEAAQPRRRELPRTRSSITHKFSIQGHEGYITAGLYEDGTPGEVFVTMAKEGSTVRGLVDAWATSFSLNLQHGVALFNLVAKFMGQSFEPAGWTGDPEIGFAKSVPDYVVRWLGHRFLPEAERRQLGLYHPSEADLGLGEAPVTAPAEAPAPRQSVSTGSPRRSAEIVGDQPPCARCGFLMTRNGSCYKCESCGDTSGCS